MKSNEIRETYLSFFEARGHQRMPSAPLVPAEYDASVLLTTAGMQPFKPYFRGQETPPNTRLTSCQKCFRTTDLDEVGKTARHLTMFEMLGNFSFGDYFKQEAIGFGYDLAIEGFGFAPDKVWMTVFGGDEELNLGPDEQAIDFWRAKGVPDEQIVRLGRKDNFWQAGPTGPCGPCSELYLDRGLDFGAESDRPGDDSERFLEFWNLVFMQYELREDGSLTELPAKNIDTGMGLERMAAILQDKPSVYETDNFWPLIELGQELSGHTYGQDEQTTKALRVLANHSRSIAFLIADGVVPSNEDRGYILRRVMRRAIQQERALGIADSLTKFTERAVEIMGDPYPELKDRFSEIQQWSEAEEAAFGRTLVQGEQLLGELIEGAKTAGSSWVDAADAFMLHDTFGFPYDMTKELLAAEGLAVDDSGFEELMDQQRERARSGTLKADASGAHEAIARFAREAERATEFTGYENLEQSTRVVSVTPDPRDDKPGRVLLKLAESPFYAEGGGQVSDAGEIKADGFSGRVADVYRIGDDQVVAVDTEGEFAPGMDVSTAVDRGARFATATHHTATHLLHAALRERLGTHVRQAGSAVRPDKLRFDFTHGAALSSDDVAAVEERVNGWISDNHRVHAITTSREEAEKLGAMALFGEKYGEWVRMVEVGDGQTAVSRELCGGTHVASTGEIGVFTIVAETSSAANVRRIEALAGPTAARQLRDRDRELREIADVLRTPPESAAAAVAEREARIKELQKQNKKAAGLSDDALAGLGEEVGEIAGVKALVTSLSADQLGGADVKDLRSLSDRLRDKFAAEVVVLGVVVDGRVQVVANAQQSAIERGIKAGELAKLAAETVGGGGGGRDNLAQAGGKDPAKLPEALDAVRAAIAAAAS